MTSKGRFALMVSVAMALGIACSAGQQDKGGTTLVTHDSGTTTVTLPDGNVVQSDGAPIDDTGTPGSDSSPATDGGTPTDSGTPATDGGPTSDTAPAADTGPTPVTYNLVITPANTTVTLPTGATSAPLPFYASLVPSTGYDPPQDVTASTTFTIDDATIGSFAGTTLTYVKAGVTAVRATHGTYVASTNFTVVGPQVLVVSGAPSNASTQFGGAVDSTKSPSIVYPNDGTIVPPNMNVFEFQYLPNGNTLFELAFKGTNVDLKVYFTCTAVGSGCGYSPDATAWKYLAEGGRGQTPVTYTLRGVDTTTGKVGVSATQRISFGLENIVGGVYYWNAGAGTSMRYEFGVSGASAETYMNQVKAGALECVGCHEISRRGHRIAFGLDIPGSGAWKVFDVATRSVVFTGAGAGSFFTFSPDETQMVSSNGSTLILRNTATGASLGQIGPSGTQPNWSADGKHIVFAKNNSTCLGISCATGIPQGSIQLLDWNGTSWASGATLAAYSGQNNYYPSFSPGSDFVVFNRSPSNQSSYDAWDAQVWAVPTAGGAAVHLANASNLGDSWPKAYVEVQRYRNGGQLAWVTFSSRRSYGLRLTNPPPAAPTGSSTTPAGTAQIWMTAIDPAKILAGQDGSYPAFWLPFQDLGSGNHIAQWVKKVERLTCATGAACLSGEQCVNGQCVGGIR